MKLVVDTLENEKETAQGWRKGERVIWIGWNGEKGKHLRKGRKGNT